MVRFAIGALTALFLLTFMLLPLGMWDNYPMALSITFHFLGGFFVAMLIASFYNSEFKKLPQYLRVFAVLGMTMSIGLIWEFFEFSSSIILTPWIDNTYHYYIQFIGDLNDTIQDLVVDTFGGIGFLLIALMTKSAIFGKKN